jgi:predicted lipoprotein with Yx(FWY)xxD motif
MGMRGGWLRGRTMLVAVAMAVGLVGSGLVARAQDATPEGSPVAAPGATPIASGSTVMTREDAKMGTILTDSDGRTLYQFSEDIGSQSTCEDKCAEAWPPFTTPDSPSLAPGVPGSLGYTTRADGVKQVMYNGHPLYYFAKDTKPGDTNGQGVGVKWFVVNPAPMFGSPVASPAAGS